MDKNSSAEKIVIEVMRHFGFRRNYQVAEYFDVTPQTLSGWIKNGEIPPKHLLKYSNDILSKKNKENIEVKPEPININQQNLKEPPLSKIIFWQKFKNRIKYNLKIIIGFPVLLTSIVSIYVFFFAEPIYISISKVLPISEDRSSQNGFSGVAAQLGINMPLSIGGTVPWDEVYPEIVKSSNLLSALMEESYKTKKYGELTLMDIIVEENGLNRFSDQDRHNRSLNELRKMIYITKDRLSPVVTLEVAAFEPLFVAELSNQLIEKSGKIQRQLKTNRIKQKRVFIEERLIEVSSELKSLEEELREFREYNRNLSKSPALEMRVQEMGREIDLQNSLYVTLKTQHEKAKIDEVERDDMVQVIDGPNIPTKLTRPRRILSIILSIFCGIFIASFTIYFRENYLDIKYY